MRISVAENAGFCFGVKRAVKIAIDAAQDNANPRPIITLGPLIHNPDITEKLRGMGVTLVEDMESLPDKPGTVILRSHGVSPDIFDKFLSSGWKIVDATCPFVREIQVISERVTKNGYQLIVVGDKKHPEVQAIIGYGGHDSIVVNSEKELQGLVLRKKLAVVVQTTKNISVFQKVVAEILPKAKEVQVYNTICTTTSTRQKKAKELAKQVDLVLVVGGYNSSNTKNLAEECKKTGATTFHIQRPDDIDCNWFNNIHSVGIVAGASTPDWIIKEVEEFMCSLEDEMKGKRENEEEQEKVEEREEGKPSEDKEGEESPETSKGEEIPEEEEEGDTSQEEVVQEDTQEKEEEMDVPAAQEEETEDVQEEQEEIAEEIAEQKEEKPATQEEETEDVQEELEEIAEEIPEQKEEKPAAQEEEIKVEEERQEEEMAVEEEKIEEIIGSEEETKTPEAEGHPMEEEEALKYSDAIKDLQKGQVITGKVVEIKEDGVFVDIGYKTEGFVPLRELDYSSVQDPQDIVSSGQEIEVYFLGLEEDGVARLSKRRADLEEAWTRIAEASKENSNIKGVVSKVVKGGLVVDIGVRGFIPASHVAIEYVEDLEQFVGQEVEMKVLEVERKSTNVVLSRRKVLEEEQKELKEKTLNSTEENDVVTGKVTKIVDFGAFVDIGGIEGLLHISEMSWGRIEHPSKVLKEGEEIKVQVLKIDRETERISLGLKQILPDPWEEFVKKYEVGKLVEGKITKTVSFGAFMEIEEGIEGLIHISQLARRHVETPEEVVKKGDEVTAKIININEEERKVGLSLKEIEEEKEEKETSEYFKQQDEGNITIGDVVGDLFNENEE